MWTVLGEHVIGDRMEVFSFHAVEGEPALDVKG